MIERLVGMKHLIGKLVSIVSGGMLPSVGLGFFKTSLNDGNVMSRGFPVIFHSNLDPSVSPCSFLGIMFNRLKSNVSSQLSFGSIVSLDNQLASSGPQSESEKSQTASYSYQKESANSGDSRKYHYPSIGFLFVFLLFSVLFSFFGSFGGYVAFYKKRQFLGATLVLSSWLVAGLGLYLWATV